MLVRFFPTNEKDNMDEQPPNPDILDIPPGPISAFGNFILQLVREWATGKGSRTLYPLRGAGFPRRHLVC